MNKAIYLLLTLAVIAGAERQTQGMISQACMDAFTGMVVIETTCFYDDGVYYTELYLNNGLMSCDPLDISESGFVEDMSESFPMASYSSWTSSPNTNPAIPGADWVLIYTFPMGFVDGLIQTDWATITNHMYDGFATETKTFWLRHEFDSVISGTMRFIKCEVQVHVLTDLETDTGNFMVTATEIDKLCPDDCCILEFCEIFIEPMITAEFTDEFYVVTPLPTYAFGADIYFKITLVDANFQLVRRLVLE